MSEPDVVETNSDHEGLPTAAVISEKSDKDIELLWNKENSATGIIKAELVRRQDVAELIENKIEDETHNVSKLKGKWQIVFEELLEEIQK